MSDAELSTKSHESSELYFCAQCVHWRENRRCWKGYICNKNGKTPACREFSEGTV